MASLKIIRKKERVANLAATRAEPAVDIPPPVNTIDIKQSWSLSRWSSRFLMLIGVGALFLAVVFPRLPPPSGGLIVSGMVPVQFEVNVADGEGHPIAGARVMNQDKMLGFTDSFGEWRRFLQVTPGEALTLLIKKNVGPEKQRTVTKNFLVPLDASKETRLVASIVFDKAMKVEIDTDPGIAEKVKNPSPDKTVGLSLAKVWVKVRLNTNPEAQAGNRILTQNLLPTVKAQFEAQGVQLDSMSPWIVELEHIFNPDSKAVVKGLIAVHSSIKGETESTSFLVNYSGDRQATSHKILTTLSAHVPRSYSAFKSSQGWFIRQLDYAQPFLALKKGDSFQTAAGEIITTLGVYRQGGRVLFKVADKEKNLCQGKSQCWLHQVMAPRLPPALDYQQYTIQLKDVDGENIHAFASGYALRRKDKDTWTYWAHPKTGAYLSVVKNQRLYKRQHLTPL